MHKYYNKLSQLKRGPDPCTQMCVFLLRTGFGRFLWRALWSSKTIFVYCRTSYSIHNMRTVFNHSFGRASLHMKGVTLRWKKGNKVEAMITKAVFSHWNLFYFILLTHEGSHPGRSTRNSNPVITSSAGCLHGPSLHCPIAKCSSTKSQQLG